MHTDRIQNAALTLTRWVGSVSSLIIHTVLFGLSFLSVQFGFIGFNQMLLVLTTIVSLEAIYLAIFIQMTINYQAQSIEEVSKAQEEMQEDIEEISEDVGEIQEDVEEISEDVEELQEDVEEISEEDQKKLDNHAARTQMLTTIQSDLKKLMADIEDLRRDETL
jgi:methyl-accepting chemotaxis protein